MMGGQTIPPLKPWEARTEEPEPEPVQEPEPRRAARKRKRDD